MLTFTEISDQSSSVLKQNYTSVQHIPLKDVDRAAIALIRDPSIAGLVRLEDSFIVELRIPPAKGNQIEWEQNGDPMPRKNYSSIPVLNEVAGERVLNALKRATELCGASASVY